MIAAGLADSDWRGLAQATLAAYGLELLLEGLPLQGGSVHPGPRSDTDDYRSLMLRTGSRQLFIMEHPEVMRIFDRQADPGWQPILARPSLFAQLAAQSEEESERAAHGENASAQDSDALAAFHHWLRSIVRAGQPSDLHLEPLENGYRLRCRLHGQLGPSDNLSRERGQWIIDSCLSSAGLQGKARFCGLDGQLSIRLDYSRSLAVRIATMPSLHGTALALRFIHPLQLEPTDCASLGMSASAQSQVRRAFAEGEGLWLVAGPTGSGKSTTLHMLLHQAVRAGEKVLAAEDPVENLVPGVQHAAIDPSAGMHFSTALRAFLRQAPDTILIGEIRDPETAHIALQAALTGHRVLSSIHARSHTGVLGRLEDLGIRRQESENAVRLILHQRLVPLLCPSCSVASSDPLNFELAGLLKRLGLTLPENIPRRRQCTDCRNGLVGRTAIFSVGPPLPPKDTSRELLEEGWKLLLQGRADPRGLAPVLTAELRQQFELCQL